MQRIIEKFVTFIIINNQILKSKIISINYFLNIFNYIKMIQED